MNKEFTEVKDLIRFAIMKEEAAYNFYNRAIDIVNSQGTKAMLKELAKTEQGHIELLNNVMKENKIEEIGGGKSPIDLEIGDYLVSEEITDKSTSQDVMINAIKREKEAYEFYSKCELLFKGSKMESIFSRLKIEELKHKERLEKEYESVVYKEM
jgi:rubrerythrin